MSDNTLKQELTRLTEKAQADEVKLLELQHRTDIQSALNTILSISLAHSSLNKKLELVLLTILNIPWLALEKKGCVFLTNSNGDGLKMVAHHNLSEPLLNMCANVAFGHCLCGKAALEKAIVFRHCIDDDHTNHPEGMQPHGHYNVPIMLDGNVVGVLNLYVKHGHQSSALEKDFLSVCEKTIATIIEHSKANEKLTISSRIFSSTDEGIVVTDTSNTIIDVNPAFSTITGYSREEAIGSNPKLLGSGKQGPQFYADMWQQINREGIWKGELWNRKKGGDLYVESATISALKDEDEETVNYVAVFTDITKSKQQQEKLRHMAHYDLLTQLPNRALFTDRFNQATAHCKRNKTQLGICFLDLDNFKPINDNYGHEVGDQLLIEVARRIKDCIRDEDTISRQGGDEFTLLLNNITSYTQCEDTLKRVHGSLAQPYLIADHCLEITASSGISIYPNDHEDIDTLLRHADQAMYQSKVSGRNRFLKFDAEHDKAASHKHLRLEEIEHALVNNEFILHYQPKINMVTGHAFGAEALIRWIHPDKGMIPPLDFLPLIDGTALEIQIGNWVIDQALIQLEKFNKDGITLEISVNIASSHLLSPHFISNLESALERHSTVDPRHLQLEILESSALGDLSTIKQVITNCQKMFGVGASLDDFGTGYSSLTHLRNIPVDTIKIDQTFVKEVLDDKNDYAIIDGIIGLADSFNRKIIAEEVETNEHGLMLLLMGCEQAQGYGIARPMPTSELPAWLENYTPNKDWQYYGNKHLSEQDNRILLFKLIIEQWKKRFISYIQSDSSSTPLTVALDSNKCHCGFWIQRAEQHNYLDPALLASLKHQHKELHTLAQACDIKYQQHQTLDDNNEWLEEFNALYNKLIYNLDIE